MLNRRLSGRIVYWTLGVKERIGGCKDAGTGFHGRRKTITDCDEGSGGLCCCPEFLKGDTGDFMMLELLLSE